MTRTTSFLKGTAWLLLMYAACAHAQAQSAPSTARSSLSLELDPAPFLLDGSSFSLRYGNRKLPHWSVMASVFQAHMPASMIPSSARDAGWSDLQLASSQALFVDRTFREDGRGAYVGASVFLYDNRVHHAASGSELAFRSVFPNVRLGYTWFPFQRTGLYLSPWVAVGKEIAIDPTSVADGPSYDLPAAKYIVALHVGYRVHW